MAERPAGHEACSFSTGIDGSVTAGRGKLDDHGFWEYPCPSCADRMALSLAHERITTLETALRAAGEKFREYADTHQLKADLVAETPTTMAQGEWQARRGKAQANAAMAEMCERALAGEARG